MFRGQWHSGQWLKLALAERDGCGISAALDVNLPARFLWQAYRSVLGRDAIPQQSPLDKAPLTWRLMRLLPGLLADDVFAPLRRFLADDGDLRKRHQLAERLADLFDQYQVYRADWLADWAEGRDILRTSRGGERELDDASRWQPALWRALLADVGEEHLAESRAGVHLRFVARLRELDAPPPGLPRRVTVFGISSLPAQVLEALTAIARFSQVMLYVHNPCQHHWGDIVEDKDLLRHEYRRQQRKGGGAGQIGLFDQATLHQHAQPLLAAWGKQGRDYINLLDQYDEPQRYREQFERIDLFSPAREDSLLGQLQNDILDLRPLAETRKAWPPVDPAHDSSLRFHVAHSAQREVEVLHDQLLASFSEDPTLLPRDVIVMVPDVNTYAPHIQAVFGQFASDDPRHIPFTLADQGLRGKEPLVIALEHLMQLPDSRFSVSEVLDLLDVAALRMRFGIAEDQLPTLRRWLEGAGIRWGLDAHQRESLGLGEGLEQNTWRFGLRRMLLGYTVGDAGAYAGIEPYDEIGGLDAALIGPLTRLLEALDRQLEQLREPASPVLWGERLRGLLDRFFLPRGDREEVLHTRLLDALDGWLALCEAGGLEEALPLPVVREAWLGDLDQGRLSQRFLAGAVNFCTLMPMRAIPFALNALEHYQLQERLLKSAVLARDGDAQVALTEAADRLQRSGVLPLAGFGDQYRRGLLEPLPAQLLRHERLCVLWPELLESPQQLSFKLGEVQLDGWLGGLRKKADGGLARLELSPGALAKEKTWKWHRLLRPYVLHVVAAERAHRTGTAAPGAAGTGPRLVRGAPGDGDAQRLRSGADERRHRYRTASAGTAGVPRCAAEAGAKGGVPAQRWQRRAAAYPAESIGSGGNRVRHDGA
nr:exodeoxyribonuclease V subunit gamma [Pseudomonas nitroreducens]